MSRGVEGKCWCEELKAEAQMVQMEDEGIVLLSVLFFLECMHVSVRDRDRKKVYEMYCAANL